MSVEVPEGHHTYEMKFIPAWLNYGLIICGVAFVGLFVLMIVWSKQAKKKPILLEVTENAPSSKDEAGGSTTETESGTSLVSVTNEPEDSDNPLN